MALNYANLVPDAEKIIALEGHLARLGMEAWQHSINLDDATGDLATYTTAGDTVGMERAQAEIDAATAALVILDAKIVNHRKRVNKLTKPV